MANKINFITGETYTLAELFSGERQIIIPDLQRDYCWGDKVHTQEKKELVSDFVGNLIAQFRSKEEKYNDVLNLGIVYGYESPKDHIQLCDGQQRMTTLFLLLGMINRRTSGNVFKYNLISKFELEQDDKEPYLRYAIRESSLYFTSDLVCKVFIHKDESDEDNIREVIEGAEWFFNEYKLDPSICSMISALEIIQDKLLGMEEEECIGFGRYLLGNLSFMYYDMENRINGEETFVVINTTGEPLSATQNLKPLVINAAINRSYASAAGHSLADDWEEMETWFWQRRNSRLAGNAAGDNDTAEAGLNEFLRWVTIAHLIENKPDQDAATRAILKDGKYAFPVEDIAFETVMRMFEALKRIVDTRSDLFPKMVEYLSPKKNRDGMQIIDQADSFLLMPLLVYCSKHNMSMHDRQAVRLYRFLENLLRIDNVRKSINELAYEVIRLATVIDDVLDLLTMTGVSKTILTDEESRKLMLFKSALDNPERCHKEYIVWRAQEHPIWSGEIATLLDWSSADGQVDVDLLGRYSYVFNLVFAGECEHIDNVRLALLTRGLETYPYQFEGRTNWGFGWEYSDWHFLIRCNPDAFKLFLDEIYKGIASNSLETVLQSMIDAARLTDWHGYFLAHPEYLTMCGNKNIQRPHDHVIILLPRQRANSNYSVLFEDRLLTGEVGGYWSKWWWVYGNCIYCDHNILNVVIEIAFENDDECRLRIFERQNSQKSSCNIAELAGRLGFSLEVDGKWYSSAYGCKSSIVSYTHAAMRLISFYCHLYDNRVK